MIAQVPLSIFSPIQYRKWILISILLSDLVNEQMITIENHVASDGKNDQENYPSGTFIDCFFFNYSLLIFDFDFNFSVFHLVDSLSPNHEVEIVTDVYTVPEHSIKSVLVIGENIVGEGDHVTTPEQSNESVLVINDNVVGEGGRRIKKTTPKKKKNTKLRKGGQQYKTRNGLTIPARRVKPGCTENCDRECHSNFSLQDRQTLFDEFWNLSVVQQKEFILKMIKKNRKARTTVANSRRQFTREYFLPKNNDEVRVCRSFFMSTFDLKPKFLRYTETAISPILKNATNDKRGQYKDVKNKTPPRQLQHVRQYIEALPAVDSHYCRNSSQRKYLPEDFENWKNLYRLYLIHCQENNYKPVSEYVFKRIRTMEYNLGIHVPKKDKSFPNCN